MKIITDALDACILTMVLAVCIAWAFRWPIVWIIAVAMLAKVWG